MPDRYIYHHGSKGQKWVVRRFQYPARLEAKKQDWKPESKKKNRRRDYIADYRMRTKAVERGYTKYADIIAKYRDARVISIKDKAYRYSEECQRIVSDYHKQRVSDQMWGKSMTRLDYVSEEARKMQKG